MINCICWSEYSFHILLLIFWLLWKLEIIREITPIKHGRTFISRIFHTTYLSSYITSDSHLSQGRKKSSSVTLGISSSHKKLTHKHTPEWLPRNTQLLRSFINKLSEQLHWTTQTTLSCCSDRARKYRQLLSWSYGRRMSVYNFPLRSIRFLIAVATMSKGGEPSLFSKLIIPPGFCLLRESHAWAIVCMYVYYTRLWMLLYVQLELTNRFVPSSNNVRTHL